MKLKILTVKKIMLLCFAVALLLIFSACGAASASAPDFPSVDPLPVEQEVPISVVYPDTEAVMLVHSAEELAELDTLYPNLRTLDVSGSKCLDAILSYAESHPDVEVIYTVSIGGRDIAFTDEVISCRSAEELNDLAACIHALPALTQIDLSAMPLLPSQINELQAVFPGLALQYNLDILGVSYPRESDTISLVGITAEDLKPVLAALPWFPNLQIILLTDGENNCSLSCEELAAIAAAAPQAALRYDFELFGTTVAADAERLEYVKVNIGEEGVETLRQVLPFMTKLNYVLLDSCDISRRPPGRIPREAYRLAHYAEKRRQVLPLRHGNDRLQPADR